MLMTGWKVGMWLIMLGYMFGYLSMFLSGLSIMGICLVAKFIDSII